MTKSNQQKFTEMKALGVASFSFDRVKIKMEMGSEKMMFAKIKYKGKMILSFICTINYDTMGDEAYYNFIDCAVQIYKDKNEEIGNAIASIDKPEYI